MCLCCAGGYSKPGFPGVIVCEGAEDDVREYVARIRALQWQAMQVRHEEAVLCLSCKQAAAADAADAADAAENATAQSGAAVDSRRAGACGRTASLSGFVQRFAELPETGLSELGQLCKDVGLEHLFLSALKLPGK